MRRFQLYRIGCNGTFILGLCTGKRNILLYAVCRHAQVAQCRCTFQSDHPGLVNLIVIPCGTGLQVNGVFLCPRLYCIVQGDPIRLPCTFAVFLIPVNGIIRNIKHDLTAVPFIAFPIVGEFEVGARFSIQKQAAPTVHGVGQQHDRCALLGSLFCGVCFSIASGPQFRLGEPAYSFRYRQSGHKRPVNFYIAVRVYSQLTLRAVAIDLQGKGIASGSQSGGFILEGFFVAVGIQRSKSIVRQGLAVQALETQLQRMLIRLLIRTVFSHLLGKRSGQRGKITARDQSFRGIVVLFPAEYLHRL